MSFFKIACFLTFQIRLYKEVHCLVENLGMISRSEGHLARSSPRFSVPKWKLGFALFGFTGAGNQKLQKWIWDWELAFGLGISITHSLSLKLHG